MITLEIFIVSTLWERNPIICVCVGVLSRVRLSVAPCTVASERLLSLWNCPGKNTGADGHSLLQETFPIQGLNLQLCVSCVGRQILHQCANWGTLLINSKEIVPNTLFLNVHTSSLHQYLIIKYKYKNLEAIWKID